MNLFSRILCAALAVALALPPLAALGAPSGSAQDIGFDSEPLVVTAEQKDAVERGLEWLAARQTPDGSWSAKVGYKLNNDYRTTVDDDVPHVGVTSLACMAFLAGGHLPGRGEYGGVVERGLAFVLSCVDDDGFITRFDTRMYSHAFGTLFLAEIYGMTHRQDVREKLQKAIDFIVTSQNEEGGWRYVPFAPESDMSIVVCQVLALRAARNIGIRVPKATVDKAAQYVVDSAIKEPQMRGRFRRSFYGEEVGAFHYQKGEQSRSSFALTAAGVTALYGVGIYSDEAIERGLEYLRRNLDQQNFEWGRRARGHYFFWYGHYYAVQAMYTAGNAGDADYWQPYFENVRAELLGMQDAYGAWPNSVGPGEAFSTAMAVLILEIPYRFLPIFQR